MSRIDRLKKWADTLTVEQLKETLVTCVDELVDNESICMWEDTTVPYWDGNGENIDGTERVEEEF